MQEHRDALPVVGFRQEAAIQPEPAPEETTGKLERRYTPR